MKTKQPEEKLIGDIICYSHRKAALFLGVSESKLDAIRIKAKHGKCKNIKVFQTGKGSEKWYPVDFLNSFIASSMR
ncbi:MAG: hypothetical protein HUK20_05865 [Fibrobacter sp.]|nr:hypothetical protein [Fibrobacter sp.]